MSVNADNDKELGERGLAFLRQARGLRGLTPMQVQRIENRLQRPTTTPRPRWLVFGLAAVLAMVLGGTALAVTNGLHRLPLVGGLFARPALAPRPIPRNRPAAQPKVGPTAPVAAEARSPAAEPVVAPRASRPHALAAERVSPIAAESKSFASVLQRWHRDRDARAALAELDTHERRFPQGQIRLEAQVLRAEILLGQGREQAGLALLDRVALSGLPRVLELQTVRGELRIKFGRCADGQADLRAVLAAGATDALAKRAAQALAHCP